MAITMVFSFLPKLIKVSGFYHNRENIWFQLSSEIFLVVHSHNLFLETHTIHFFSKFAIGKKGRILAKIGTAYSILTVKEKGFRLTFICIVYRFFNKRHSLFTFLVIRNIRSGNRYFDLLFKSSFLYPKNPFTTVQKSLFSGYSRRSLIRRSTIRYAPLFDKI